MLSVTPSRRIAGIAAAVMLLPAVSAQVPARPKSRASTAPTVRAGRIRASVLSLLGWRIGIASNTLRPLSLSEAAAQANASGRCLYRGL